MRCRPLIEPAARKPDDKAPARLEWRSRESDPLHATIEELTAEGYTHVECFWPRSRLIRLGPMSWLPRISMGLTIVKSQRDSAALSAAVR